MKSKASEIETEIAELMRDLERVAERLAKTIGSTPRRVMAEVEEPLREHLHTAQEAVEGRIQKRPLASVLVAFFAGLTLSTLLWR